MAQQLLQLTELSQQEVVTILTGHLGCGFPVNFEFPPLPGKPSSVCLATEFA